MNVIQVVVGAFQENAYVVADPDSGKAAVVDPGSEPDSIAAVVNRSGYEVEAIWLTHAHVDHIGAVAPLKELWHVPIHLHSLERPLYRLGGRQAQLYGIPYAEPPEPDIELVDGQKLAVGSLELDVFHAPGHSPGHVVIHGHGHALVGDCLFAGSVGRTDLPFSNPADLEISLRRIAALPPETIAHPGHGESTTIGEERRTNPFLNGTARIVRAASNQATRE